MDTQNNKPPSDPVAVEFELALAHVMGIYMKKGISVSQAVGILELTKTSIVLAHAVQSGGMDQ